MQQNRRLKRAPPSACYREKTENNKHKKATRAQIAFFIYNGPNGKREFNLCSPIILGLKILRFFRFTFEFRSNSFDRF